MTYLNPEKDPNKWLEAVLLDLLKQDTPESKQLLKEGIQALISWFEPGLIDDLFAPWIDQYMDEMADYQNNRGIDVLTYSPADHLDISQQSSVIGE